jgi:hypothetical protein
MVPTYVLLIFTPVRAFAWKVKAVSEHVPLSVGTVSVNANTLSFFAEKNSLGNLPCGEFSSGTHLSMESGGSRLVLRFKVVDTYLLADKTTSAT